MGPCRPEAKAPSNGSPPGWGCPGPSGYCKDRRNSPDPKGAPGLHRPADHVTGPRPTSIARRPLQSSELLDRTRTEPHRRASVGSRSCVDGVDVGRRERDHRPPCAARWRTGAPCRDLLLCRIRHLVRPHGRAAIPGSSRSWLVRRKDRHRMGVTATSWSTRSRDSGRQLRHPPPLSGELARSGRPNRERGGLHRDAVDFTGRGTSRGSATSSGSHRGRASRTRPVGGHGRVRARAHRGIRWHLAFVSRRNDRCIEPHHLRRAHAGSASAWHAGRLLDLTRQARSH